MEICCTPRHEVVHPARSARTLSISVVRRIIKVFFRNRRNSHGDRLREYELCIIYGILFS